MPAKDRTPPARKPFMVLLLGCFGGLLSFFSNQSTNFGWILQVTDIRSASVRVPTTGRRGHRRSSALRRVRPRQPAVGDRRLRLRDLQERRAGLEDALRLRRCAARPRPIPALQDRTISFSQPVNPRLPFWMSLVRTPRRVYRPVPAARFPIANNRQRSPLHLIRPDPG